MLYTVRTQQAIHQYTWLAKFLQHKGNCPPRERERERERDGSKVIAIIDILTEIPPLTPPNFLW